MIRQISSKIVQGFAITNKSQNFFDMNPIYPDYGEKNFDIYNSQRKKINVIDQFQRTQAQSLFKRRIVRQKIFIPHYDKFKKYSGGRKAKVDKDTLLQIGLRSQFDQFVESYKRDLFVDKNAASQFKATILKLIHKFKCKSEADLIRLFRISIANMRKRQWVDKIRGQVISDAVVKAAFSMKNQNLSKNQPSNEEEAFSQALKQIDEKIEKAEQALRYNSRGVPKVLSNYDPKYGWMETREETSFDEYDLDLKIGAQGSARLSSLPNQSNLQDWSIKSRINRLYFLRRLEFLKRSEKQFKNIDFLQELPLNIRDRDKIMNQIAFKYKEEDLIQVPDIDQIYREIDAMIDKVYVKISPGSNPVEKTETRQEIYDRSPEAREFLWSNINAEEILCDTMYNTDSLQDIVLTQQAMRTLSPSTHTELTLTKIPVNLFRHTELECFGMFNQYKEKLGTNLMGIEEIDYEPQFSEFTLEKAKNIYKRIEVKTAQKGTTAHGRARRKTAFAEVNIKSGTGKVKINGRELADYFGNTYHRVEALKPLIITDTSGQFDIQMKAYGSGLKGQSECLGYALARALIKTNPEHKRVLAGFGLVGNDFRKKEPKKTNLYSARVRPPYVRR